MSEKPNHWAANWALYDMVFYEVSKLETFRKLLRCGYSRREAAEEIRSVTREG